MACSSDFVQYIVDQCSGAGVITVKKMMGDYCIYCNDVIFGVICDNNLYIKETDAGRAILKEVVLRPPYSGAKGYFYIGDVDDRDYLEDLIRATMPALKKSPAKRNSRIGKSRQVPTSLDDVIEPNLVCSQELRLFFEKHLGPGFRYKVEFQGWLHDNAGMTYRDAVEAYKSLEHPQDIWPQFEYNQYIRDFFLDNKGASLEDAIECWYYKKKQQGSHRYDKNDLVAIKQKV